PAMHTHAHAHARTRTRTRTCTRTRIGYHSAHPRVATQPSHRTRIDAITHTRTHTPQHNRLSRPKGRGKPLERGTAALMLFARRVEEEVPDGKEDDREQQHVEHNNDARKRDAQLVPAPVHTAPQGLVRVCCVSFAGVVSVQIEPQSFSTGATEA